MYYKATLLDEESVKRTLRRISHEIVEKNKGCDDLCLVGILRRGVPIAKSIAENIYLFENKKIDVGTIDISLYRDDISELTDQPTLNGTDIPFDINGKKVVLVDDVLYTGRTARAAIDALISIGRPAKIQFAVLIDRGHRELPICANFIGKNFPTSKTEMIKVCVQDYDNKIQVDLYELDK